MQSSERKLACIKEITEVRPIPGADAIECAVVDGGWTVVIRKGEFEVGDLALYLEIDCWVPFEMAPFMSKGKEPREYNGVKGERLRSIRLRGQLSQGLLLDTGKIFEIWDRMDPEDPLFPRFTQVEKGQDFTEFLREKTGLQKWEAPVPACLAGMAKGNFPSFCPKTDAERCQNLVYDIFEKHKGEAYEVTVKLDGSSCTVYVNDGDVGVCSRNLDLKETDGNSFWKAARAQGLIEGVEGYNRDTGRNIALQMEILGEGIQKNQEGIRGHRLYLFDIYDIDRKCYLPPEDRYNVLHALKELGVNMEHAPVLERSYVLTDCINNVESLLRYAEGPSLNEKVEREGLVFKSITSGFKFKAISNKWLLKKGE